MDYNEINDHLKQVNKDITGMNKEIKQHQKDNKQKFNDSTLTLLNLMSEDMRNHNASEQSLQLAIKGTYEFYKVVNKAQLPISIINSLLHPENTAQQNTSSFGTPLSEIKTQPITWLWENRIPQGKITPLALLAESMNCAFLVVRHLKKGSTDNLLYRGAGSIGIIAAARTCLTIFYDPADEKKRVLAVTKSNLAEPPKNLSYQVVTNQSITPHIQWLGEINLDISTLIGPGINLSFPRQEIIKALQSSQSTLDLKEIAEKTGLNYKSLRMTVSRMHEAGLIAHPFRGRYTTLEQDAESKKRLEERLKARELENEAFRNRFAPDATVTTDANTIVHPGQDICINLPVSP